MRESSRGGGDVGLFNRVAMGFHGWVIRSNLPLALMIDVHAPLVANRQ